VLVGSRYTTDTERDTPSQHTTHNYTHTQTKQSAGFDTAAVRCVLLTRLTALGAHSEAAQEGAALREEGVFERGEQGNRQYQEAAAAYVESLCTLGRQVRVWVGGPGGGCSEVALAVQCRWSCATLLLSYLLAGH